MSECISNPEFGCACVDRDSRACFEIRYDRGTTDRSETAYSDTTKPERCGCPCHDGFNDDAPSIEEIEAENVPPECGGKY